MDFKVLIKKDEDGYYVATVPSLPGCISQGKTEKQALKNIKEAIALHRNTLAENGIPLKGKKPGKKNYIGIIVSKKLPVVSGADLVEIFKKIGYYVRA